MSARQASLEFIKWFASDAVQMKWAELGGYTCNKKALASDAFLAAAPYNAAFAETMGMVKDFYNIPEYGELLPPAQTALSNYVVGGQGTAQEALDAIAAEHDQDPDDLRLPEVARCSVDKPGFDVRPGLSAPKRSRAVG